VINRDKAERRKRKEGGSGGRVRPKIGRGSSKKKGGDLGRPQYRCTEKNNSSKGERGCSKLEVLLKIRERGEEKILLIRF